MKSLSLISLGLLFSLSCSRVTPSASHSKAQIDSANNLINRYGLSEMPTYDELLKYPNVQTKDAAGNPKLPWTDTYWATVNKNLATRWGTINAADEANTNPYSDFQVGAFFKTQLDAIHSDKADISINLSPAEKFDIAYRSINKLTFNADNSSLKAMIELDAKHADFLKPDLTPELRLTSKRSLAREYLTRLRDSADAQNIANFSPLAAEGYTNWFRGSLDTDNIFPGEDSPEAMDWSWEGICHGWAPAAVMEDEPKHAVQVAIKDGDTSKTMLFTEGDIRALLDKSWAQANNDEEFFVGRRCEKNLSDVSKGVPSNADGRGVGGSMSYIGEDGVRKTGQFTVVQDYPRKSGMKSLFRVILEDEWLNGEPKYAYLIENISNNNDRNYKLSFKEAEAFAQIETPAANSPVQQGTDVTDIELFGCWDANPASFHSILVENIGKKNLGFVMDRTQSGQVWNQPIGKADFVIGELQEIKVLADKDKARFYRAPGTVFVAEVTAVVYWAAEPYAPRFSYTQDGSDFDAEQFVTTTYHYTLEFDADKKLIGGEWGTLESFKAHENPDFLFGYTAKVEPNLTNAEPFLSSGYQSIIKKIHACSLSDKIDGEIKADLTLSKDETITQSIPYVKCEI